MSRVMESGVTRDAKALRANRIMGAGLGRRVAAGLIAGMLGLGAPVAALADTLADALAGAYNNSGLLEQNRALLRAADEDVAVALSALRPIVGWSAGVTYSDSR